MTSLDPTAREDLSMYVPSTISEIYDRIGAMVLCMPDMELPYSDLGMDGAYEQLEHSLGLVRDKLGDDRHQQLVAMARESKRLLEDGQLKEGLRLLQDMGKLLLRRRSRGSAA